MYNTPIIVVSLHVFCLALYTLYMIVKHLNIPYSRSTLK